MGDLVGGTPGTDPITCPHCQWSASSDGVRGARELEEHLLDDHRDVLDEDGDRDE